MAGDSAVRSLLEKMVQCASNAYLGILERYILQIYCHVVHWFFGLQIAYFFMFSQFTS